MPAPASAGDDDVDEHESEPQFTLTAAGLWLAGITVVVAILSELLTGSIEEVCAALHMSICLALVHCACMHTHGSACLPLLQMSLTP